MLAALLSGKEKLSVDHINKPEVGEDEVLLKTKSAMVCGTDIRMFKAGRPGVSVENPLVLGHEVSGIIERVGSQVKHYKPGMAVAVAPNMGCGTCDICVSGNTHLCPEYKAIGINLPGGFAEYVLIPKEAVVQGNIVELPHGLTFEEAAIAEPLSCAFSAFERCQIKAGDSVLIFGAGPIGIMHAKLAKMGGAAKVMFADPNKDRLNSVKSFDKSFITIESSQIDSAVKEYTNGKGIDVSITACPSPEAQCKAVELAALNGRVMLFGGLPADKQNVAINTNLIHYRQIIVTGTTRSSLSQFRKTIELIANKSIEVKSLITSRFTLDRIGAAFAGAMNGDGIKNTINFE